MSSELSRVTDVVLKLLRGLGKLLRRPLVTGLGLRLARSRGPSLGVHIVG